MQFICLNTLAADGLICSPYADGRAYRTRIFAEALSPGQAQFTCGSRIHALSHRRQNGLYVSSGSFSLLRGRCICSDSAAHRFRCRFPSPLRLAAISERSRKGMPCGPHQRLVEVAEAAGSWQRRSQNELTLLLIHSSRPDSSSPPLCALG